MSAAHWVNDAAMKSKSSRIPNSISEISRSERNGIDSLTPGTLTPLFDEMVPPLTTRHLMPDFSDKMTDSSTSPSSMRMRPPRLMSRQRSLKVTEACFSSPCESSNVSVNSASFSSVTGEAKVPSLISGPFVSSRSAMCCPISFLTCFIMSATAL